MCETVQYRAAEWGENPRYTFLGHEDGLDFWIFADPIFSSGMSHWLMQKSDISGDYLTGCVFLPGTSGQRSGAGCFRANYLAAYYLIYEERLLLPHYKWFRKLRKAKRLANKAR